MGSFGRLRPCLAFAPVFGLCARAHDCRRESVSEDDVPILCTRLVGWLVKLVEQDAPALVIKKICSTLVVFFIRFSGSWPNCIRHLVCCLAAGRAGRAEEFAGMPTSTHLLKQLDAQGKLALLWFTANLVEEVGKVDTKNINNHHFCVKMQDNETEAVELIRNAIEMPDGLGRIPENFDGRVVTAGLNTFQAWVFYSLRAYIDFRIDFPLLKTLTPVAIHWLASDDIFETACDVVIDILSQSFSFFTHEDNLCLSNILVSSWAVERYELMVSGDSDWGSLQFGRLLVTFAEATVHKLAESLHTPSGRAMIEMLHGILKIPGYPQVDDEISATTFEFWGSLVDYILDEDPDPNETWIEDCRREIRRAVEEFWRKIRIPTTTELSTWTKDQKDGFMSFRKDVGDFVESAYILVGKGLFQQLVDQVTGALVPGANTPWEDIEASLFCLNSLGDSLSDAPEEDVFLGQLFGSNLFMMLADPGADIPQKARTTSVNLIGSYASFFERRPEYLPQALNFLFTCISNPFLARNASKSISSLCSSCRTTLTTELYAFLHQYEVFSSTPNADDIAKERVLTAIAYVVQALPSDEQKLDPISKLLGHVENDVQQCLLLMQHHREEEAKETGLLALRCMVSIGKGLQAPDDFPVDLSGTEELPQPPSFWETAAGGSLQGKIVDLVRMLCHTLRGDGEVIDAACSVFKTGFTEMVPGLFVFRPDVVTEFLLEYCARTETILATASTLINSHSMAGSAEISAQVRQLLGFVAQLVEGLGDPQNEPEIAQSVVEFLTRLLRRYVGVLVFFHPGDHLERMLFFALNSLVVREVLVKKAAASFWSTFLALTSDAPDVQAAIARIVEACGPTLAEKLCWALGGGCQRSDVDTLAEPLKKLVVRQPRCKAWLLEALKPEGFPTANVSEKDKRMFVDKVLR